jgi:hypothetical protein
VETIYAATIGEIDTALAKFSEKPDAALMVSLGALFTNLRIQIVELAAQHAVPAIYSVRNLPRSAG